MEFAKTTTVLIFSTVLLLAGLYFLYNAFKLISAPNPQVAASLLATVIGLSLVSAGITLIRTWLVAKAVEAESGESSK